MINVGIIGDKGGRLARVISQTLPHVSAKVIKRLDFPQKYDILIVNEASGLQALEGAGDIAARITLLNSDSRADGGDTRKINPGQIITYGFNGKSCITASSVNDDSILVCIQRILFTLDGAPIMPHEFVSTHNENIGDTYDRLGAYACGAICGIDMN